MTNLIMNCALTLGICSGVAIASTPVFAQTTPLNLTITGGSFSVTNNSSGTSVNSGTVITPLGTAVLSSVNVATFQNLNTGFSVQNGAVVIPANGPDTVGNNLKITGTANGNITFDIGGQKIFRNAGYNVDGKIASITFNPATGVPTSSTSVVNLTGGNLQLPTSLSSSSQVGPNDIFVPITGGSFAISGFLNADGSTTRNGATTLITPYGTVNITAIDYNTGSAQNVTAINSNRNFDTTDAIVVGDILQFVWNLTGSIPLSNGRSANLNSMPTLIEGKVTSFQMSPTMQTLKANVTGGEIFVPASNIINGSGGNNSGGSIINNSVGSSGNNGNPQQSYYFVANQFLGNTNGLIAAETTIIFKIPNAIESQSGQKVSSYRVPMGDRILGIMCQ